jgi:hypothetical protein
MTTSRIDEFKTAGLINYRKAGPVVHSLVDAHRVSRGRLPGSTFVYNNGLTCEHPEGAHHDCDYVTLRNSKIPAALQMAARNPQPGTSHEQRFCAAMDELMKTPGWKP